MKKTIKWAQGEDKLYVVIQQYIGGSWGVAFGWFKLPYAAHRLSDARIMKEDISDAAIGFAREVWKRKNFKIVKFSPAEIRILPSQPKKRGKKK